MAELGGKTPVIVFKDANIEDAVNGAAFAAFIASGQTCVTGSRLLIDKAIKNEFLDKLVAKVSALRLGDPQMSSTQIGPVISQNSLDKIHRMVSTAVSQGGKVLVGGNNEIVPSNGYFYPPTIIDECTQEMEIFQKEVFGPVLSVSCFSSEEEAIELANATDYGLAASVWTGDVNQSIRVSDSLDCGIVWINGHHHVNCYHLPIN